MTDSERPDHYSPQFLGWGIWVKKLSIQDWDISGLHTGANNLGSGRVLGCAGTPIAASEPLHSSEVGAVPMPLVQGPNPAQSQGVKRFISCWHAFIAPSLEESGRQR